MAAVAMVLQDFSEMLLQLRYPRIAQVTSENNEELLPILGSENRLFLLSWLLAKNSLVSPDESFANNEDKIVKWYTCMGICTNVDALLGKATIQEQLPTLRNLLAFARDGLAYQHSLNDTPLSIYMDVLKTHIAENYDIIPSTCSLTAKLNCNETIQNLSTRRKSLSESRLSETEPPAIIHKCQSSSEIFGSKANNSGSTQEGDTATCAKKFIGAFESVSSWSTLSNESATPSMHSLDSHINNIHSNMEILKETMRAKEEISKFVITDSLEKPEMPLDRIIENIVIHIEELSNFDN